MRTSENECVCVYVVEREERGRKGVRERERGVCLSLRFMMVRVTEVSMG